MTCWTAGLLDCYTARHKLLSGLWKSSSEHTRSRLGSHIFCLSQVLSCNWKIWYSTGNLKRNFPPHSQCDFVNYNQFWPNDAISPHPQINIAVLDSLEKHHCAASSPQFLFNLYCRDFTIVRRWFVAISISGLCEEFIIYNIVCNTQNHIYDSISWLETTEYNPIIVDWIILRRL